MKLKERLRRLQQSAVDRMAAINNAATLAQRELNEAERLEYGALKLEAEQLAADLAELERTPVTPSPVVAPAPAAPPNADALRVQVRTEELARQAGIDSAAATFLSRGEIDATFVATAKSNGQTVEQFKLAVLDQLAARSAQNPIQHHLGEVVRDEVGTRRELMASALLNRISSANPVDGQNDFRGRSLMRMAEESLSRSGVRVRGMAPFEIAVLAMQGTADFPYALENVARKQLLNAYQIATPTYKAWTKASTSPDFKTMARVAMSQAPALLKVAEGGQIQPGPLTEVRETYSLATYGRSVVLSLQAMINDDLGAFNNLVTGFGGQCARLENKIVYAILQANAAMSDTNALFVDATHGNLGTGVLGNTAFDLMFGKMGIQKDIDGVTPLSLRPKYLITPVAKGGAARAALAATNAAVKGADQNMYSGMLTHVEDPELDLNGSGTTVWYGAADPNVAAGIEYCHLEGAEGPQILRTDNANGVLGMTLSAFLHFAAKAVDWKPLYKSTGA